LPSSTPTSSPGSEMLSSPTSSSSTLGGEGFN
jgi:hypothetical protein